MYNLNAPNSKFKVGILIKVLPCHGIDSNTVGGMVIPHYNPDTGYLRYLKEDNNWVPVELQRKNGSKYKTYMPFNSLEKVD